MAFLCPVRIRRNKKKHGLFFCHSDLAFLICFDIPIGQLESDLLSGTRHTTLHMGRITGSASIETLVRVGIEKEHGLSPDSKMIVLHDFTPCVDDELEVRRGQIVNVLYQENDWVYVISENQLQEGFIPFSYCAPIEPQMEQMMTYKKKMPRSGPGSVVSEAFNEISNISSLPNDNINVIGLDRNFAKSYASTCGAKSANGDPLTDTDVELMLQNNVDGETMLNIRSTYSQESSMPGESASQKHYNSMLNVDIVSNNLNMTNVPTATGSVIAPSRISTYSEGARSTRSGNGSTFKNSTLLHNEANFPGFTKNSTLPYNCYGSSLKSATGAQGNSGLRGLESYLNNSNNTSSVNYQTKFAKYIMLMY